MALRESVGVLGAGAIGCLWAAKLAKARVPTTLILRANPHGKVCHRGRSEIRVESHVGAQNHEDIQREAVHVDCEDTGSKGPPYGIVVVSTKAFQAKEALLSMAARLSKNTVVIIMCNGALALAEELPREKLLADPIIVLASCTHGAYRRQPFDIVHAGVGDTWCGVSNCTLAPSQLQRIAAAVSTLGAANLGGSHVDDALEARLWQKLAVSAALNPLTALWECLNGDVLLRTEGLDICQKVASEVESLLRASGEWSRLHPVAQTHGIRLDAVGLFEFIRHVAACTCENRSSMLQDIDARRPTEIDYLGGWLVRYGLEIGSTLPTVTGLVEAVRAKELALGIQK